MGDIMNLDKKVLDLLLSDAKKAYRKNEIPVSAIILDKNGKIISHSYNNRQKTYNVLGHAEIISILKAEKKVKDWRLNGYVMIVSLEPCDMCSRIIEESRIENVYFFVSNKDKTVKNNYSFNKLLLKEYDYYVNEFSNLLTLFFNNMR